MTDGNGEGEVKPQALVVGDFENGGWLKGRAGGSEFPIGGPDGLGGKAVGANPYELLSASLAACTAMTIRLQARRKKFPLSHIEVAVSYSHAGNGGRDSFERVITLEGGLDDEQRANLMQVASMCPVGRALGLSADIRTRDVIRAEVSAGTPANYDDDLWELPIPNLDPD
jgi:putative redox protein